jgi:hypothetical protein
VKELVSVPKVNLLSVKTEFEFEFSAMKYEGSENTCDVDKEVKVGQYYDSHHASKQFCTS